MSKSSKQSNFLEEVQKVFVGFAFAPRYQTDGLKVCRPAKRQNRNSPSNRIRAERLLRLVLEGGCSISCHPQQIQIPATAVRAQLRRPHTTAAASTGIAFRVLTSTQPRPRKSASQSGAQRPHTPPSDRSYTHLVATTCHDRVCV